MPDVKRAKLAISKRGGFAPRERKFIKKELLVRIVNWCVENEKWLLYAKLFVFTYAFLLRLPSEALPATAGSQDSQSSLEICGDDIVLRLRRRKNKPSGSVISRRCLCRQCETICPFHTLLPLLNSSDEGGRIFGTISASSALRVLRSILEVLGVSDAALYRTHDLRRGHCMDLLESGAPLATILKASEWRSPAFLSYVDMEQLERDAVIQAHLDDSDCEPG